MPRYLISNLLALVGAIIGGVLGFYTFLWLLKQGYYGLIIPGAFLGLGCSLLATHRSVSRGILCGIAAFALSQFADWYCTITDASFVDFLRNGKTLTPVTLLMTGVATVVAFWIGGDAGFGGFKPRGYDASPAREREPRPPG
jgi:nitrogen fixation-related uncharacterized protein